jgi:hypothetical protein
MNTIYEFEGAGFTQLARLDRHVLVGLFGSINRRRMKPRKKAWVAFIPNDCPGIWASFLDGHKVLDTIALNTQTHIGAAPETTHNVTAIDSGNDLLQLAADGSSSARCMLIGTTGVSLLGCGDRKPAPSIAAVSSLDTCFSPTQGGCFGKNRRSESIHGLNRTVSLSEHF